MRPSRSAPAATAMVVMVLVGLVLVGRLSAGGLRSSGPPAVSTESRQAAPPPRSTTPSPVTLRLPLGRVDALAVQGDAVWAAHGCVISRVDARSGRVVAAVRLTPTRCAISASTNSSLTKSALSPRCVLTKKLSARKSPA